MIVKSLASLSACWLVLAGSCSRESDPVSVTNELSQDAFVKSLSADNVISQDLSQLQEVGVPKPRRNSVFSIGWNQFIGPNIVDAGTIGKAFVDVHSDSSERVRPVGIDIGTVTLSYDGGGIELSKVINRRGEVVYTTFARGLHAPETLPVNIPFIANAAYQFNVSGSDAFSAGTFAIVAPPSLLDLTSPRDGDTIRLMNDLIISWTGGYATDSVLLRIVPHLRRGQFGGRGLTDDSTGDAGEMRHGPRGGGPHGGRFRDRGPMGNGEPRDFGVEFRKGIVRIVANTGTATILASDIQDLLSGTEANELMIGVAQVITREIQHDDRTLTILLRNGDRLVNPVE